MGSDTAKIMVEPFRREVGPGGPKPMRAADDSGPLVRAPRIGVVMASDLSREGRWDASFHLTVQPLKERLAELRTAMSDDQARAWLRPFSLDELKPLEILSRRQSDTWSDRKLSAIVREYPHLSVAVMEQSVPTVIEAITERLRNERLRLDDIAALLDTLPAKAAPVATASTEPARFQAGMVYPLRDPTRYDDEFGTGYGWVATDPGCDPGDAWVLDVWIVNEAGENHPGYGASPIPVRPEDVDLSAGKPLTSPLPQRTSVFQTFR